jgi:SAM-dependent methyltransferase
VPPTADNRQYITNPGDARLYGAGYAEFMRRTNVRLNSAALITALIADAVDPGNVPINILDLGCNDGAMTSLYLAELMKRSSAQEFHVTLVDPAAEALAKAATLLAGMGPRLKTSCLPTTAESFVQTMEGKYDIITALWIFYHIQPDVIVGLLSMLKQYGLLIVSMGSPTHPIKSYGKLAQLSRHGDSRPVERFLVTARSKGMLTFDRLSIPTQIELNGLWEREIGVTDAGKEFFSFMFNRDFEQFSPDAKRELDILMEEIMRDQAGIASHDHFLYMVRAVNKRRLSRNG